MELQEILSVAIGTLLVVVISHFAVFWVVRTLYPPSASPIVAPVAVAPVFTPPPVVEQQNVVIPTYEAPIPVEAPREERKGPPAAESTSIRRESGVDAPNA